MTSRITFLCIVLFVASTQLSAQSVEQRLREFIATKERPHAVQDFSPIPHLSPLNQDTTLICWSFSTSSFIESEMQRLGRTPVRLSVLYPLYNVYLEKAKRYVTTKGSSRFAPGDLFSGVVDIARAYGAVPAEAYGGVKDEKTIYNQKALYEELDRLMKGVRAEGDWNEHRVVEKAKEILDRRLGAPPATFIFHGTTYTPRTFADEVLRMPWNDYVLVTSFEYAPFYRFTELRVPDNWKHDANFFNVPLDVFYAGMKEAVSAGYSVAFDADISEPSYELTKDVAIIPDFDIPISAISQEAREFRFDNGSTTDDHLMHAVAFKKFGKEEWFLVKDSWRTAWEGSHKGYFFFHESYMKLKALAFLVHKDGVPSLREKLREAVK